MKCYGVPVRGCIPDLNTLNGLDSWVFYVATEGMCLGEIAVG